MTMLNVSTLHDLRKTMLPWREKGETVAFVPTMGALHKGHLKLVEEAKKAAKRAVVSIFVNPTQFAPSEDFTKYPRSIEADKKLLTDAGCDLLYMPAVSEIYPEGFAASVDPGPLGKILEGAFRPGHFAGVATVVTKLLLQVMPDAVLFGEKDYQQLLIIRRVTQDLNIPVHIIGVPIVREADGLALSSRNVYLSAEERSRAALLQQTLQATAKAIRSGDISAALAAGMQKLGEAGFKVDYLELADPATLAPIRSLSGNARLLVAAHIGKTRLIDNIVIE